MTVREKVVEAFITKAGYGHAKRQPLAGDASFRTYERLFRGTDTFVLMDAPPPQEDVRPFIAIAHQLRALGLSAPEIYAADVEAGLLILEDLGDDLFFGLVGETDETDLYRAAVDLLIDLQDLQIPHEVIADFSVTYSIPNYSDALLTEEVNLFADWYCPLANGADLSDPERLEFREIWQDLLVSLDRSAPCLVLRDYHAQNLIWLPGRAAIQKVGLLDFQDAVIGSRAYDLVSLLEDARRDVGPETVSAMKQHYCRQRHNSDSSFDEQQFLIDYAILAAQRNTKIIGIFARLFRRDGKPQYLDLIPRVWKLLEADVTHPCLAAYKAWLDRVVLGPVRSKKLS